VSRPTRASAATAGASAHTAAPLAGRWLLHFPTAVVFALAAVALIPLAWGIGEATEHAAEHVGHGLGGFLNATFGNVPEVVIALFAIADGLPNVVLGAIAGSVVSNLLLVLGSTLLISPHARLDTRSLLGQLALVGLAVGLLLVPHGIGGSSHEVALVSLPVALVLVAVYGFATVARLRRQRREHVADCADGAWSLRVALIVLVAATAATALVSDVLVDSLDAFGRSAHLSQLFVAAVIVAITGNAAEHGAALLLARRGKLKLATEIAVSSGAQVALLVSATIAFCSWTLTPLALDFRPVELGAIAAAAALAAAATTGGRSSRMRGAALLVAYVGVAAVFLLAGD
jgi:Ca2+:H+ antiporter